MDGRINYAEWKTVPDDLQVVIRMRAAGLLMVQNLGTQVADDEYSRNGYVKKATARKDLIDFVDQYAEQSGKLRGNPELTQDTPVFPEEAPDI